MVTWNFCFDFSVERKCTPYLITMQRSGQILARAAFPAALPKSQKPIM
jgi:hypothetical protein